MGVIIRNESADYSGVAKKLIPPVLGGATLLALPGADLARTARNYIIGRSDGAAVGSPVYEDGYATFTPNTNMVDTTAPSGNALTIMCAIRITQQTGSNLIGNNQTPREGDPGTMTTDLLLRANDDAGSGVKFNIGAAEWDGVSGSPFTRQLIAPTNRSLNTWYFLAATVSDAAITLDNMTADEHVSTSTGAGTVRDVGSRPLRIGGSYNNLTAWRGTHDMALAAVYSRVLSSVEIQTFYEWARDLLAEDGITI